MYSKRKSLIETAGCIVILVLSQFCSSATAAEVKAVEQNIFIKAVPNKCVALRKGRECFATIKVKWKSQLKSQYCLRRQSDNLEINCWENHSEGDFFYVFSSSEDEQLVLVRTADKRVMGTSKIKVSWVYNSKKRRSRWRVF